MDNANYHNPAVPNFDHLKPVDEDLDKPIPLDDLDEPIPLGGPGPGKANVSHTPLNLGGPPAAAPATRVAVPAPSGGRVAAPVAAAPAARAQAAVKPAAPSVVSSGQITGVKTFFTKLHPGAIEFMDEQICNWLKKNPGVFIKRTNVTTGDVQSKKTEPNILVTVWY